LVAGASYDPLREELFLAIRGGGATLNGEPIRVTSTADLSQALLCTGFPYDVRKDLDETMRCLAAVLRRSPSVRRLGSAALDLAYVACGRFDGFWEARLNPWDVAAGVLLVQEAGGTVTDYQGGPGMLHGGSLCAGNRPIHPQLLQLLTEARGASGR
jgi:myo-inositol-1(or 4)-monophosphatase